MSSLPANLVFNHSVPNVLHRPAQRICILNVVEKTLDVALASQQFEFFRNSTQFPNERRPSDSVLDIKREQSYRSSAPLLDSSLVSPSGIGARSISESASTRGANDSIDCLFAFVRWFAL